MVYPLRDIRVLDLSQAVSGPYTARALTDLGADVVKVEWPRGDVTNVFGQRRAGLSGLFTQMNAGKRGIAVDRATGAGRTLIKRLAVKADVVIENFRPGVLERAGLSYAALASENPGLVMLSISGFGSRSPESQRQAYAPVIHAESGLLARQSEIDRRSPADLGLALADTLAALHGTIAILASLRLRDQTNRGQHIDLGMLQAMVASDDYTHNAIDGVDVLYPSRGDIWDAPGGPIMIAADAKTLWVRYLNHTGASDPSPPDADLATKVSARANAVATWIASFDDREELIAELEAANLPWADLRTTATLLDSPTLQAAGAVVQVDDHAGATRGVVQLPYRFSDADSHVQGPAPARGQHNRDVLRDWLGIGDDELAELAAAGALLS